MSLPRSPLTVTNFDLSVTVLARSVRSRPSYGASVTRPALIVRRYVFSLPLPPRGRSVATSLWRILDQLRRDRLRRAILRMISNAAGCSFSPEGSATISPDLSAAVAGVSSPPTRTTQHIVPPLWKNP